MQEVPYFNSCILKDNQTGLFCPLSSKDRAHEQAALGLSQTSRSIGYAMQHAGLGNAKRGMNVQMRLSAWNWIEYVHKENNYGSSSPMKQAANNPGKCEEQLLVLSSFLRTFPNFQSSTVPQSMWGGYTFCSYRTRTFSCQPGHAVIVKERPDHPIRGDRRPIAASVSWKCIDPDHCGTAPSFEGQSFR